MTLSILRLDGSSMELFDDAAHLEMSLDLAGYVTLSDLGSGQTIHLVRGPCGEVVEIEPPTFH